MVHAGGAATGVEVERALVAAVRRTAAAVYEHWFARDLVVEDGRCAGVTARRPDGTVAAVRARHVLVATGGAGQLFAVTTNPTESTGDGIAMALRAGVAVADLEFVQFHPTALHHPSMPRPLLTEALRGHGALLRDSHGERFVDELLPRDKVSRAIMAVLADQDVDHVWLDVTGLDDFVAPLPDDHRRAGRRRARSRPRLAAGGPRRALPVRRHRRRPRRRHLAARAVGGGRGGVQRRPRGEPAGVELAARRDGVRAPGGRGRRCGPRRPASDRGDARVCSPTPPATGAWPVVPLPSRAPAVGGITTDGSGPSDAARTRTRDALQRTMTSEAGVLRSSSSLGRAAEAADRAAAVADWLDDDELRNLATVGAALAAGALARTESRGAHARTDFPDLDPAQRVRYVTSGGQG